MADSSVTAIIRPCIGNVKVPHELRQIRLRGLYDQVKVISHQHVGMEPHPVDVQGDTELL